MKCMDKEKKYKDYLLSGETFSITQSKFHKGILETLPVPKNTSKYYESNDYISHSDDRSTLFNKVFYLIKIQNIKYKINLIDSYSKKGELLDYGCGVGDFLIEAKRKGWSITGIEPSIKAATIANKKGVSNVFLPEKMKGFKDNHFDCVTLWHVLEHVQDLDTLIDQLKRVLKPNGKLVIAVPNYNSFDSQYYKEYWAAWDVPRHIWHFSRKGIKQLFNNKEMSIVKEKPLWFDSFYISLLSGKYKNDLLGYIISPIIGLISNIKGYFTKEFSSVIYIFEHNNQN